MNGGLTCMNCVVCCKDGCFTFYFHTLMLLKCLFINIIFVMKNKQ